MSEIELLLDSSIRTWVVLPIVLITFLFGIIRHYLLLLMASDKKNTLEEIQQGQALMRSRLLRENGKYIPERSFLLRKEYLLNGDGSSNKKDRKEEKKDRKEDEVSSETYEIKEKFSKTGIITKGKETASPQKNPMSDPTQMGDMLKGNLLNVFPMLVIGGWINWAFSGFVTVKVPFPLTIRFKTMLQRGIELDSLDASWVSSASWYFLNVFGLRSLYSLILGQNNAADQTKAMQDQFSGSSNMIKQNIQGNFKSEWEALQIAEHADSMQHVEDIVLSMHALPEDKYMTEKVKMESEQALY